MQVGFIFPPTKGKTTLLKETYYSQFEPQISLACMAFIENKAFCSLCLQSDEGKKRVKSCLVHTRDPIIIHCDLGQHQLSDFKASSRTIQNYIETNDFGPVRRGGYDSVY